LISAAFSFDRRVSSPRSPIALFIETFVASVQIEEAKLSHANILRSKPGRLESDLHGSWKKEFFEAPILFLIHFLGTGVPIASPHRIGRDDRVASPVKPTRGV
jgi:hypothetical protein